ncbi:HEAT repeat domain-containing protein [Streptomyces sp. NPDC005263]|uniref:HEAT repeat domain-containing protein n=1 Tax=Streptomyces sp. NPDC005263 TaxID=3364711 RepID=UPI0036B89169
MFTGIDEVDWAALRHAYGSAEDVPGLLRGLASPDRTEREGALDRMYGALHHQGTVYDATLACVPFLLTLAGSEAVPEREGIVELLVSIGGDGPDQKDTGQEGPGRQGTGGGDRDGGGAAGGADGPGGARHSARAAIRAGAEAFVRLAGDADASVRGAAASALVRFLDEPARVLGLLRERISVERDERVQIALAESLGLFVRRHPAHADGALDLLVARSAPPNGPGLRLAALGQLMGCAPVRAPADPVPLAVRLLRERSARRSARWAEDQAPGKDTLVGRLWRLWPSDEEGSRLLRSVHAALDDRVADRTALLEGQLTSPDPTDRCNALWMAAGVLREWRGDHAGLVTLIGDQLGAVEGGVRDAAVSVLTDLFGLAAPAADPLAALVASRSDLWVRRWPRGRPVLGGPLRALARSGDPRAVPVLAEVLAGPVVPGDLGQAIGHLGGAAAALAPVVRRRLGEIHLDSPAGPAQAAPLLSAVLALGDLEALPEVMRLVRGTASAGLCPDAAHVPEVVGVLGAFGPAAREATPVLRRLLDTEHAIAAAGAWWEVTADASVVRPLLLRELEGADHRRRRAAAEVLARMGPAARPAPAALRRGTESGHPWDRVTAARALWRIDADAEPVLPVLQSAWTHHPHTRGTVAECLVEMGPAARPLGGLPAAELSSRRRHLALPGGYGSHDILKDERLLALCREVPVGQGCPM